VVVEEQTYSLVVTMHHIVTDGWSMGLFVNESMTVYAALVTGQSWQLQQ